MPRPSLFEYRAWPETGSSHIEALYHLFGLGIAEMRTDTYIFPSAQPDWMIAARGGTAIEVFEKVAAEVPLTGWRLLAQSDYPLQRPLVRKLQEAFPSARFASRMAVPGDFISWVGREASVFAVNKRTIVFQRDGCRAEYTELETEGRRADTFCLLSKRADIVRDALAMLPAPPLPNLDFGSWLHEHAWGAPALEPAAIRTRPLPVFGAARVA